MADNNDSQTWITDLKRKLQQKLDENKLDLIVDYKYASKAFPGNPHSSRGHNAVDFHSLTKWGKANGWIVASAPEITPPDQQSVPWIRFTRIQE